MRRSLTPVLLVVLLVAAVSVPGQPLRGALLTVLRFPFTAARTAVSAVRLLPRLPSLSRENDRLRAELAQRHFETAHLREQLRHVQKRQALLTDAALPRRGIVALVLSRSTLPTQQTVWLDKGGRDGLTVDSVILDAAGVVGRVTELHPSSALVTLLTDPESRAAALVERSRETGLLMGRGRGQCELIYLEAQADLKAGDRVVTAGLGGPFPKGLLLGRVVRVVRDEPSGAASAWVAPAARLGRLEEVLCLPSTTVVSNQ